MIPVLFEHDATTFEGHGLGELIDSVKCTTKITDTGEFELELTYPIQSRMFDELKINRIISAQSYPNEYYKVKYNQVNKAQAFRIYGYEKSVNGLCIIKAQHITYDMTKIIICPSYRHLYPEYYGECIVNYGWWSAGEMVSIINANQWNDEPVIVYGTNPFILSASGYPHGSYMDAISSDKPRSLRSILFGSSDSLLANFGGAVFFDNYNVSFQYSPLTPEAMVVEYGTNLIDLKQEENISEMYTGILPFAITKDARYDNDNNHYGPKSVMYGDVIYAEGNFYQQTILPVDLSEHFTKENLSYSGASTLEGMPRNKSEVNYVANLWFKERDIGVPEVNLTIDYAHLPNNDPVFLYDLVRVRFVKLGIEALARVASYTFDSLNERCAELELGKSKSSITQNLFGNEYSRKRKYLG